MHELARRARHDVKVKGVPPPQLATGEAAKIFVASRETAKTFVALAAGDTATPSQHRSSNTERQKNATPATRGGGGLATRSRWALGAHGWVSRPGLPPSQPVTFTCTRSPTILILVSVCAVIQGVWSALRGLGVAAGSHGPPPAA